jgi:hypothetical protein
MVAQSNIGQTQANASNPLLMDNSNGGNVATNGGLGVAQAEQVNNTNPNANPNNAMEQAGNSGEMGGSDTYEGGGELEGQEQQEQDPNRLVLNWGLVFTFYR